MVGKRIGLCTDLLNNSYEVNFTIDRGTYEEFNLEKIVKELNEDNGIKVRVVKSKEVVGVHIGVKKGD